MALRQSPTCKPTFPLAASLKLIPARLASHFTPALHECRILGAKRNLGTMWMAGHWFVGGCTEPEAIGEETKIGAVEFARELVGKAG